MTKKPCLSLVGNPGVGQSTLLSTVLGKSGVFQSGISFGGGLTKETHLCDECDEFLLADTPGLADVELRAKAAKEISSLFRSQSNLVLIFVVVLEAGRIQTADVATMTAILQSLQPAIPENDLTDKFGIVINKVSKRMMTDLKSCPGNMTTIEASFNAISPFKTQRFQLLPMLSELEDVDNGITHSAELMEFICHCPTLSITKDMVKDIDISTLEETKTRMQQNLDNILHANAADIAELKATLDEVRNENRVRECLEIQPQKHQGQNQQQQQQQQQYLSQNDDPHSHADLDKTVNELLCGDKLTEATKAQEMKRVQVLTSETVKIPKKSRRSILKFMGKIFSYPAAAYNMVIKLQCSSEEAIVVG